MGIEIRPIVEEELEAWQRPVSAGFGFHTVDERQLEVEVHRGHHQRVHPRHVLPRDEQLDVRADALRGSMYACQVKTTSRAPKG